MPIISNTRLVVVAALLVACVGLSACAGPSDALLPTTITLHDLGSSIFSISTTTGVSI